MTSAQFFENTNYPSAINAGLVKDYQLEWKDWKNLDCGCRIRIYTGQENAKGKTVVLATDINVGQSVTNEAETIATLVCRDNGIEVGDLYFIEHYEERINTPGYKPQDVFYAEDFSRVVFRWNIGDNRFESPKWSPLNHRQVALMIGSTEPFTRPAEFWDAPGETEPENKTERARSAQFTWDFIKRFYPNYDETDEVFTELENFNKVSGEDFEEGDETHKWLIEIYGNEDNPKFRADFNQKLVEVYENAIDNFLEFYLKG